ncbi:TraK family protein [Methyloterricola oryzae]|uniref:TraK family protein n=1 Tax=Methyloterricola oryzae TaxID=1495050 RepID=UPI0005EB5CD7|nr:TraK family protein [Methyloterricola oryzae]
MAKSYIEELGAWVKQREPVKPRQESATVAFLAVKENVVEALAAGYALTTIWEHMHESGLIKSGYETFRKHVRRYIQSPSPEAKATRNAVSPNTVKSPHKTADATSKEMPQAARMSAAESDILKGFRFSPVPNKEELF